MTVQFSVAFSSLLVEYQHFIAFYQRRNYFANHFGSFYGRSTHFYFTVVVYQQNFVKFNSCTAFCVLNVLNKEFLSFFYFELLTVNFYNYVHFFITVKRVFSAR